MNKFNIKDKVVIKSLMRTAIVYSIQFFHSKGIIYELWDENEHDEYDIHESDLELFEKYSQ